MKKLLLLFTVAALGSAAFSFPDSGSDCCDRENGRSCTPSGKGTCSACSDCSKCKHCKAGGTCSVCKPPAKKADK